MAVGSKDGRLSVIQISENLSTVTKNDKAALTSVGLVIAFMTPLVKTETFSKFIKLLERETRREKTLEQRSKDGKGKQGAKAGFHMAVATVAAAAAQQVSTGAQPSAPASPTSSSKKVFDNIKETLQALQNQDGTSEDDSNRNVGIEPSADMILSTDNRGSQINLSISQPKPIEPTVDQHLQTSEESFFETIDQVCARQFENYVLLDLKFLLNG